MPPAGPSRLPRGEAIRSGRRVAASVTLRKGDRRGLNPCPELHTLLCCRYTTITIEKVAVGLSPTWSALQADASILGHATRSGRGGCCPRIPEARDLFSRQARQADYPSLFRIVLVLVLVLVLDLVLVPDAGRRARARARSASGRRGSRTPRSRRTPVFETGEPADAQPFHGSMRREGFAPPFPPYQGGVLLLNYPRVRGPGLEPGSRGSKPPMLPLHHPRVGGGGARAPPP